MTRPLSLLRSFERSWSGASSALITGVLVFSACLRACTTAAKLRALCSRNTYLIQLLRSDVWAAVLCTGQNGCRGPALPISPAQALHGWSNPFTYLSVGNECRTRAVLGPKGPSQLHIAPFGQDVGRVCDMVSFVDSLSMERRSNLNNPLAAARGRG